MGAKHETIGAPDRQIRLRKQGTAKARGRHIPDDKFRAHFCRKHTFHVRMSGAGGGQVQGREGQRLQYGGYWFEVMEVWPFD